MIHVNPKKINNYSIINIFFTQFLSVKIPNNILIRQRLGIVDFHLNNTIVPSFEVCMVLFKFLLDVTYLSIVRGYIYI